MNIPVRFALSWLGTNHDDAVNERFAAGDIAHALRGHGDVFLAIADALFNDHLRAALLPLPTAAAQGDALRALACDDPPTAHRLAHALRDQSWRDAIRFLIAMPSRHAVAILGAMDDAMRCGIVDEIAAAFRNDGQLLISDPVTALVRTGWDTLSCETRQRLHTLPSFADLPLMNERPDARIRRSRY